METILEPSDAAGRLANYSGRGRVAAAKDLQHQRASKVKSMVS